MDTLLAVLVARSSATPTGRRARVESVVRPAAVLSEPTAPSTPVNPSGFRSGRQTGDDHRFARIFCRKDQIFDNEESRREAAAASAEIRSKQDFRRSTQLGPQSSAGGCPRLTSKASGKSSALEAASPPRVNCRPRERRVLDLGPELYRHKTCE